MIKRDTTAGLAFEDTIVLENEGQDISKNSFYVFLDNEGIDYTQIISKKLIPDKAYYDSNNKIVKIYEIKYQACEGSVDEKLQTCDFKLKQFKKLVKPLGLDATYTYILCDWFKKDKYRDVLDYIKSIDGCDYIFSDELNEI